MIRKSFHTSNDLIERLVIESIKYEGYLSINKVLIRKYGLVGAGILSNYIKQYSDQKGNTKLDKFIFTYKEQIKSLNLSKTLLRHWKSFFISESILIVTREGCPSKEYFIINWIKLADEIIQSAANPLNSSRSILGRLDSIELDNKISLDENEKTAKNVENLSENLQKIPMTRSSNPLNSSRSIFALLGDSKEKNKKEKFNKEKNKEKNLTKKETKKEINNKEKNKKENLLITGGRTCVRSDNENLSDDNLPDEWEETAKEWFSYKKKVWQFTYKDPQGFINNLKIKANNDVTKAKAMINQSILHQWQGLFPIYDNLNRSKQVLSNAFHSKEDFDYTCA